MMIQNHVHNIPTGISDELFTSKASRYGNYPQNCDWDTLTKTSRSLRGLEGPDPGCKLCHLREIGAFAVEPAKVEKTKCRCTSYGIS